MVGPKLLWVEDRADEIAAVYARLVQAGCDVKHVTSRASAVEHLRDGFRCQGIVLDMCMPDEKEPDERSGEALFRDLRRGTWGSWSKRVPVIFASGYADLVRQHVAAIHPPPLGLVEKPLPAESSTQTILEMMASPSLRLKLVHNGLLRVALEDPMFQNIAFPDQRPYAHCQLTAPTHAGFDNIVPLRLNEAIDIELPHDPTEPFKVEVEVLRLAFRIAYAVVRGVPDEQ
jgi:CheY-like chemotaxis protein